MDTLSRENRGARRLLKELSVYASWLFGSWVNGYKNTDSDIDVCLVLEDVADIEILDRGTKNRRVESVIRDMNLHLNPILKDNLDGILKKIGASSEDPCCKEYGLDGRVIPIENESYVEEASFLVKDAVISSFINSVVCKRKCKPEKDLPFYILEPYFRLYSISSNEEKYSRIYRGICISEEAKKLLERAYLPTFEKLEREEKLILLDEKYFIP